MHNNYYANLQESGFVWKGEAYVSDIRRMLIRFLGEARTGRVLRSFFGKHRISGGRAELDIRPHSLHATITTAINGVAQIAGKKDIVIKRRKGNAIKTHYDEDRMRQVLTNLLSNAIKFTGAGPYYRLR